MKAYTHILEWPNVRTIGGALFSLGSNEPRQVPRHVLAQLIEPRVEEIFELAKKEIQGSGYYGLLPMGVALTGGSALLPRIAEVATQILETPTRVETPRGIGGMVDSISSPVHSTSVGLLKYAAAQRENSHENGSSPNLISSMVTGIRRLFR